MLNELSNRPKVKVSASPDASSCGAFRFKTMSYMKNSFAWVSACEGVPHNDRIVIVWYSTDDKDHKVGSAYFTPTQGWVFDDHMIDKACKVERWIDRPIVPF